MAMTIKQAEAKLTELEGLQALLRERKPGYDQKIRATIERLVYGDIERMLVAHITRLHEAIRFYYIEAVTTDD